MSRNETPSAGVSIIEHVANPNILYLLFAPVLEKPVLIFEIRMLVEILPMTHDSNKRKEDLYLNRF
jgi:hypothetical protein